MNTQLLEAGWLDARQSLAADELARACGLTERELDELIEYGALRPAEALPDRKLFSAEWVAPLRTAGRLRRDFDLDVFAIALLLEYLQRITVLERELKSLRAQLPGAANATIYL